MDAIELIERDHQHISELFERFFQTGSEITQEELYQCILTSLDIHTEMEEEILYPALRPYAPDKIEAAEEEHHAIREILVELLDESLNEKRFEDTFLQLLHDVRRHVQKEEAPNGILDLARRHLSADTLAELAKAMGKIRRGMEEDLAA